MKINIFFFKVSKRLHVQGDFFKQKVCVIYSNGHFSISVCTQVQTGVGHPAK